MENDEYLTKFHGLLLSLSTKRILNKPPYDSQIKHQLWQHQLEELSNFIACLPYSAKNKITYYMILNTNLLVYDKLQNDEFVGLFVNITPAIKLKALIQWIYILNLFNEFCKAIENMHSALVVEFICEIQRNESFKNIKYFYLRLWQSLFKKVYKLEKENFPNSSIILFHHFKIISQNLEDNTCLSSLEEFLITVLDMVTYYKNPVPDDEMYKLSIQLDETCTFMVPDDKCIDIVFKTASVILNIMKYRDNILTALEECKRIRNLSYRLLKEIRLLKVPADLLDILSKLAVKESDALIESLILDAKHGKKCHWPRSIINAGVTEPEWPLHTLNNEDLDVLLQKAFENLETSGEEMKELFLAAVTISHNEIKWLEKVFDKYQPNLLNISNTSTGLVEAFNKISSIEKVPTNVIIPLCMQSPVETIKTLCHLAISSRATNNGIFQILKPACQVQLPNGVTLLSHVIISILSEELTSAEEDYFHHFVIDLKTKDLLGSAFLENLIKLLKEFLEKDEINKSAFCLTVMNSFLVEMELVNKIALLVFMSQVLGYFSWNLETFSTVKANGRDVVCSIVGQLIAHLDCNTDREILNRARKEILKCWEVNQACFCDLWFKFGKMWHGSGRFDALILALIHSSSICCDLRQYLLTFDSPHEVRTSIILALTKILPVLNLNFWNKTFSELKFIWEEMNPSKKSSTCYEVFQMFVSAWYLLTLQLNENNDIQSCYRHCTSGFGRLFSSACLEGESLLWTYEKILFLIKSIENEEIRKSCYVILFPVLKNRLAEEGTKNHSEKFEKILTEEFKS